MSAAKDPFYRQIIKALSEISIDQRLFEECMGDLLRDVFPGLVPVPGGSDGGFDGAIGDGEGIPYPLVCTTAEDVIGNLTKSLDSCRGHGFERNQAVLATSRPLTPQKRRHLEQRAREKNFLLLQIFEQRALADRLYHSPRWCRELLGLSGTVPVLSQLPPSRRPQLEIELIGREADVEWLRNTDGDRLISGEPGSGKTYLVDHLVRTGWGLFLTSDERAEIAETLRALRPEVVVVDDAHFDLSRLEMLRHVRREVGARFSIVAISWQGDSERVAAALGDLPASQLRQLELLTPTQILEVLRQAGVAGPDWVLHELIDQADRKPGLAVTLARLYLGGDLAQVLRGEALRAIWANALEKLIGPEATPLLAAISLGGDQGMLLETTANYLGIGKLEARRLAIGLAAAGVLSEPGWGMFAVVPRALRSRLLCRFFFDGSAAALDYQPLLERVPFQESGIEAVIVAAQYGAKIALSQLQDLVARCRSLPVWRAFTALGEDQARWALDHFPGDWLELARLALIKAPRATLPKLLERSVGVTGLIETQPEHPLAMIMEWIRSCDSTEQTLERRRLVVQLVTEYLQKDGDHCAGARAFLLTLFPLVERGCLSPDRQQMFIRWRPPDLQLIRGIEAIWEDNRHIIKIIDRSIWQQLRKMIWGLFVPRWSSHPGWENASKDVIPALHDFAARVLLDLRPLAEHSPGLTAGLVRLAQRVSLDLHLTQDPVFELLYPPGRSAICLEDLQKLAAQWVSDREPRDVVQILARYEIEAELVDHEWPRMVPKLSRYLAREAEHPEIWLQELLKVDAPADLLIGFLEQAVALRPSSWEHLLRESLERERYAWPAAKLMLCQPDVPAHLLERALAIAPRFLQSVETLCLLRQVPLTVLRKLLQHASVEVAVAAAVGEYHAEPKGVRAELDNQWRAAVRRAGKADSLTLNQTLRYWLDVLTTEPVLADPAVGAGGNF